MHAMTLSPATQHRNTRYQRVVMLFVLVFLALQLIGAVSHTHAYTLDHKSDCAACEITDMPFGAPPPPALVAPVATLAGFTVTALPREASIARAAYLTPPAHAPPAAVLS
nr:hypothetical protein [uncultured Duganella sp.]